MTKKDIFIITLVGLLVYCMIILYLPFLYPIGIAIILAIATSNIHTYIKTYIPKNIISAIISTILLCLVLFLPIVYFVMSAIDYANTLNEFDIKSFMNNGLNFIQQFAHNIPLLHQFDNTILEKLDIAKVTSYLASLLAKVTTYSASFLINMFLIIILYTFVLIYGESIFKYIKSILPLDDKNSNIISQEITGTISMVFYSILLNAMLQGALFGVFVYFFGYNGVLLGILYGLSSLIPVIGGAIMWVFVASNEAIQGNITNAIYIILYSIVVISIIADTIIKPFVIKFVNSEILKTEVKINEMLVFFSIIAGISTFGFWGMIIGPTITATFISVTKIYKNMIIDKDR